MQLVIMKIWSKNSYLQFTSVIIAESYWFTIVLAILKYFCCFWKLKKYFWFTLPSTSQRGKQVWLAFCVWPTALLPRLRVPGLEDPQEGSVVAFGTGHSCLLISSWSALGPLSSPLALWKSNSWKSSLFPIQYH